MQGVSDIDEPTELIDKAPEDQYRSLFKHLVLSYTPEDIKKMPSRDRLDLLRFIHTLLEKKERRAVAVDELYKIYQKLNAPAISPAKQRNIFLSRSVDAVKVPVVNDYPREPDDRD